ncbi:hypothetical protein, conserved, partial [Eimeria tenella]
MKGFPPPHGGGTETFLTLRLPDSVISRLKPWSARDVQSWGAREDEALLIGAYKYGFGAWAPAAAASAAAEGTASSSAIPEGTSSSSGIPDECQLLQQQQPQEVSNDPNLCLPQIRDIKFDKLKMRALRTLKLIEKQLLHSGSSSSSSSAARNTRSLRPSPVAAAAAGAAAATDLT